MAKTVAEDIIEEETFDWNDERKKKYELRQEKHAHYFSPLSIISELTYDSNTVKEKEARHVAETEWNKTLKMEREIIAQKREKERQVKYQIN